MRLSLKFVGNVRSTKLRYLYREKAIILCFGSI